MSMPFKSGNKLGAQKRLERPLDKEAIAFKGYKRTEGKIKSRS